MKLVIDDIHYTEEVDRSDVRWHLETDDGKRVHGGTSRFRGQVSASPELITDLTRIAEKRLQRRGGGRQNVTFTLRGPDGEIKQRGRAKNLVTDYGDEYNASRSSGVSPEDEITGMRLGTDDTAPAKNGAGAAIVGYVTGSAKAIDNGFPTVEDNGAGSGHDAIYQVTWDAGEATEDGIEEVVITNEDALTDSAGTAGNTIARFLLGSVVNKGADDSLEVEWTLRFNGS